MRERDLIDALARGFPRAPEQVNGLHEADAEILRLGNELWAVTVDDFSPREDLFMGADPGLVGWNVVAATLSDLFCVGAQPRFFLPSVCLPPRVEEDYLVELSRGVREALHEAGSFLIGGDVGTAHPWRYVGTALGPIPTGRPITRRIPPGDHSLWVSGALGAANLAAALGNPPPRFPLRQTVAEIIRGHTVACMDTSGGFMDAAWTLAETSPGIRLEVEISALPLAPEVSGFSAASGIPREAVLLGGAGEYELLFVVPDAASENLERPLTDLGCRRVGRVHECHGAGSLLLQHPNGDMNAVSEPPPCPRSTDSMDAHIREVVAMSRALFGERAP